MEDTILYLVVTYVISFIAYNLIFVTFNIPTLVDKTNDMEVRDFLLKSLIPIYNTILSFLFIISLMFSLWTYFFDKKIRK